MPVPNDELVKLAESVSVVIPLYNGSKYIAETLDSILAQTVSPGQIIVVNDGSTDDSPQIVQTYAPRVTLITVTNGGQCKARNIGVAHASGKWLALCDSDDLWLLDKLEKQLRLVIEAPDVHYVITDYADYTAGVVSDKSHLSYAPVDFWQPEPVSGGFVVRQPLTGKLTIFQPSITSTPLVRRDFYLEVGGFDEALTHWGAEDTSFHFQCLSQVPFAVVPEVLMHYRRHPGSVSADTLKQLSDSVEVWKHIIKYYPQAQPYRAELESGLKLMKREVKMNRRYRRRQKIKHFILHRLRRSHQETMPKSHI